MKAFRFHIALLDFNGEFITKLSPADFSRVIIPGKPSATLTSMRLYAENAGYGEYANTAFKTEIPIVCSFESKLAPEGIRNLLTNFGTNSSFTDTVGELDRRALMNYFGEKLGAYLMQQGTPSLMLRVLYDTQLCLTLFGYTPEAPFKWYVAPKK